MNNIRKTMLGVMMALFLAGTASAANIPVTSNIATSTTWTSDNIYNLVGQIYVLPGATLTIQPGTLIKNHAGDPPHWDPTLNGGKGGWVPGANPGDQGSLAVCRGAKIFAMGTKEAPIIFTSDLDTMTAWHEGTNEWGNLTLMGNALISASFNGPPTNHNPTVIHGVQNPSMPTGTAQNFMEGLIPADSNDTKTLYGGNDDNDSSGELHYVSLRYGGKVVGLGNELNGLSMGGIGRGTKVDHIDTMNSVDDYVETWGGTVNYKYLSLWNGGDDGFDTDEGWRGKAQFGIIVQGFSNDAPRGSGVSDNGFESDGAEDSDAQPVSTNTLYNWTLVGQPLSGHSATAWRDNNRAQYRNMIFMDVGSDVVGADNTDGDNGSGYGFNGTLSFADTWTTPYTVHSAVNAMSPAPVPGSFNDPNVLYQAQSSTAAWNGMLAEIVDSVFFRNIGTSSHGRPNVYSEADDRGVTIAGGSNPAKHNVVSPYNSSSPDDNMPIKLLQRHSPETKGSKILLRVTRIDPRAAHDAVTSDAVAPADGFFTQAPFRGAFSPNVNWLLGWTAADAYGFLQNADGSEQTNPADPVPTIQVDASSASISFPTTVGVSYAVEQSSDMKNWVPLSTVTGDGTVKSVTDTLASDSTKFYRVFVL